MQKLFKKPGLIRFGMNIWPPFLFAGIRIIQLQKDYRYLKAELKHWRINLNVNRSQFGGSIMSMTDPLYSILLIGALGEKYYVWDKFADVNFIAPGYSCLSVEARLTDTDIQTIKTHTANGEKYFPKFVLRVCDKKGQIVAEVQRTLYVRLKPEFRP
ncbi:DUF4442 domain-containing protein [Gayadomonas joobiniege]|uniref:DUF4442 domain-containing protein n=1 Tax=Gayadomonas joobiniege TaxID=1234606 RepID=UPI000475296A|nr:DUF4442 domain-containing protein [Gayadomonas joobiniege]